jgi:hypothetical protein
MTWIDKGCYKRGCACHDDRLGGETVEVVLFGSLPVYDTPLQRTWVGLTDEEAQWLYDNCRTPSNLIDMVEASLKEKNT